ncbi:UNVERIFIED_CONTAM: hypothetical protein Slati_2718000 [Sesamum latifolium]|uniref:Uncharacterized protein n=1 Tax=Sesamum latifolium TaxID=2727402 RepID=A0AAW2VWR7_9LAMI
MAFILPKRVIREVEKRIWSFLWKGSVGRGYAKVAWDQVCRPQEQGGLGIRNIAALNKALMSWHLWRLITKDYTSIWVKSLYTIRLQNHTIWTVKDNSGPWGWRKLLRIRPILELFIEFRMGDGSRFSLWKDPWHPIEILLHSFSRGPQLTGFHTSASLASVIREGEWAWPQITDIACLQIIYSLPPIHGDRDRIIRKLDNGIFSPSTVYNFISPSSPKVDWSSLLMGRFKIPRQLYPMVGYLREIVHFGFNGLIGNGKMIFYGQQLGGEDDM